MSEQTIAKRGRKSKDGAEGLFKSTVTINQETKDILKEFGDGDLSYGIREAAKFISESKKKDQA